MLLVLSEMRCVEEPYMMNAEEEPGKMMHQLL